MTAVTSALAHLRTSPRAGHAAGLCLVAGTWLWSNGSEYHRDLAALGAMYALVALGAYIPFILGGSVSLAYPAYLSIGGLAVAVVADETSWPLVAGIPIGVGVAIATSVVLTLATRRLSGFHLAAVTLLFTFAFTSWMQTASITGGVNGRSLQRQAYLLGWELDRAALVALMLGAVGALAVAVSVLRGSPFGIALRSLRTVPEATAASGYSPTTLAVVAMSAGAAITAVAGSLFTLINRSVGIGTFSVSVVFLALFIPLLGGQRTPWGVVLGAVLVIELSFDLDVLEEGGTFVFSMAVLVVLVAAPDGLLGLLTSLGRRLPSDSRVGSPTGVRIGRSGATQPAGAAAVAVAGNGADAHPTDTEVLAVTDVSKSYGGVQALSGVGLVVRRSEVLGLVGPNGAGKTTLVDIVCGVTPPTAGRVTVAGRRLPASPAARARAGLTRTFQHPRLSNDLTVEENLLLARWGRRHGGHLAIAASALRGLVRGPSRTDRAAVAQAADTFGLHDLHRTAAELPLGQQRLAEVVRGLLMTPDVLLLDEPFAGSDPVTADAILSAIEHVTATGCAVVLVDHNVDLVAAAATTLVLIDSGRVTVSGPPEESLASPEMQAVYMGRSR